MENAAALLQVSLIATYAGTLFLAGMTDCRTWTIPNRFPAVLVGLYPVWVIAKAGHIDWLPAILAAAIVFAVGAFFFSRGWMGGGDVKLMSAAMLWAAPAHGFAFLAATALAGGALAVWSMLHRRLAAAGGAARDGTRLPYGAAIATGGILTAALLQIN